MNTAIIRVGLSTNWLNPVSWLICLITRSKWSHVYFVCSDGEVIDASWPAGVQKHWRKKTPGTVSREISLTKYQPWRKLEAMHESAMNEVGKRYQISHFLGYLLGRTSIDDATDGTEHVCFQFAARMLAPYFILPTRNEDRIVGRHFEAFFDAPEVRK